MLNQQQIQQARSTLGITPVSSPSANRSADFKSAVGGAPAPAAPSADTLAPSGPFDVTPGKTQVADSRLSHVSDIGKQASAGANQISEGMADIGKGAPGKNPIVGGVENALKVGSGVASVVTAPLAPLFKPLSNIISDLGNKIGENKSVQEFANSKAGETTSRVAEDLSNAGNIAGTILGADQAVKAAPKAYDAAGDYMKNVHDSVSNLLESKTPAKTIEDNSNKLSSLENIRAKAATGDLPLMDGKGVVSKQTQTSAKRLAEESTANTGPGAAVRISPAHSYDQFVAQEGKHLSDIKEDPAISKVGSEIGDNYDKVIQMRRDVGKQMEEALTSVKDTPVDISSAVGPASKFTTEMQKGVGKMTTFDKQLIDEYNLEVKSLGPKPTAEQLDNFLSRVPNQLDVAKAAKNVTNVTNAERIIKGNLADIRNSLTSQPGMEPYAAARKAYSSLSNFLDEGSRFLGAKTQSGDYARDASIAKSAVQSVLNAGKKDWLVKLEGLTGYQALDRSVLALQAMKDMGDFKGNSLLDLLTHGAQEVPTPSGLPSQIIGFLGKKAAKVVAGSNVDQTRAFLRSLK